MLNEILTMLEKESVFESLGMDRTVKLIRDVVEIALEYDCNAGEILEDIGESLGICYYCLRPADLNDYGLCKECSHR